MTFPYLGTFDFAHPWYLLWVIPGVFLLALSRGGFVKLGSEARSPQSFFLTRLRSMLPLALLFATMIALGFGFADLGNGHTQMTTEESLSRIIVTQDQSGSMYGGGGGLLQCVFRGEPELVAQYSAYDLSDSLPPRTGNKTEDRKLKKVWAKNMSIANLPENQRIEGSCMALETLLDDLEERARVSKSGVRHEVAFLRFADTSILQEPFTTDYAHLRSFLSEHDWRTASPDVGSGTSIHRAFYDMFMVALRRHIDAEPGMTAIPESVLKEMLGSALVDPKDNGEIDKLAAEHSELFRKLGLELADTSLVMITDATEKESMWRTAPSTAKMLRLARLFHMPVYVMSTQEDDMIFRQAVEATGGAERPGGFFVTNKLDGYRSMKDDMKTILDRAFFRKQEIVRAHRDSYAAWCFGSAFFFLILAFFLKEGSLGRSLTQ